jgi:Putative metal-binding motif/FG-GAP repeat
MRSLPLLTLLVACVEEPAQPSPFLDFDHDGYNEQTDCDDHNPIVHPDAAETCNGLDDNCDGEIDELGAVDGETWFADSDGDSFGDAASFVSACEQPSAYVDNAQDCDDNNADVLPTGTEVCDDADNDCDGNIDEGTAADATVWYRDEDGDGWGTEWDKVIACDKPSGYVADVGDCDDTEEDTSPESVEVCDDYGGDEDCDNLSNDDDTDPEGQGTWYADGDGDGFGDVDVWVLACDQPSGFVGIADDCDDAEAAINPNNAEICGDVIDNDCDGTTDEDDGSTALVWYLDADGDGYGDPAVVGPTACTQPTGYASAPTDCNDGNSSVNPGASEVWYDGVDQDCNGKSDYDSDEDGHDDSGSGGDDCDDDDSSSAPGLAELCSDGADNNCDGVTDPCDQDGVIRGGSAGDNLGGAVSSAGDWNGDGQDDLLVAADKALGGGSGRGVVYVVSSPIGADGLVTDYDVASLLGESDHDRAGSALATLGDTNDDGFSELVIGALGHDSGGASAGAVYVVYGPRVGEYDLSTAEALLIGEVGGDQAGTALSAAGDVDGDGVTDLLIGAWGQDAGGTNSGGAYLMLGPIESDLDLSYADTRFRGETAGDQAGSSVSGGGDVNGDGYADLIMGAPYRWTGGSYTGGAYLVLGPVDDSAMTLADADAIWVGTTDGDLTGYSVALIGDTDGDGSDEFAVGAPEEDTGGADAGAVYILTNSTGTTSVSSASGTLIGEKGSSYFGSALAAASDMNLDGNADLAVGARLDDTNYSDAGAGYIFLGPLSGTIDASDTAGKVLGTTAGDWAGAAIAGVGDLDGDGVPDVAVGGPTNDDTDADAGAVWFLVGFGD